MRSSAALEISENKPGADILICLVDSADDIIIELETGSTWEWGCKVVGRREPRVPTTTNYPWLGARVMDADATHGKEQVESIGVSRGWARLATLKHINYHHQIH
jgi:hypothetical protein